MERGQENQEQIIFDALGEWPVLNKKILNPFRPDRSPKAYFRMSKGRIRLMDHAAPQHSNLDCWDIYMRVHGCTFKEAMEKYERPKVVQNKMYRIDDVEIRVEYDLCDWTGQGEQYWAEYGISTEQLEKDGVGQCSFYRFNSRRSPNLFIEHYPTDPCFAMNLLGRTKIYRPMTEEREQKWTSDFTSELFWYIRASQEPSERAFVGSSYKDIRCVANACPVDCVALGNSETVRAEALAGFGLMKLLKGYKEVLVGMDFDRAGTESMGSWSKALSFHGIPHRLFVREPIEGCKDYAELRKDRPETFFSIVNSMI
jgi:hypothetical protein